MSPQALKALHNLRNTNPDLFKELSSDTNQPQALFEMEDEPTFPEIVDDPSDIPINIVTEHLASGSCDVSGGYIIEEDGSLLHASAVENPNSESSDAPRSGLLPAAEAQAAIPHGRGHRKKIDTRPFGGSSEWWEHYSRTPHNAYL
ncbi:hypothetical protein H0H81_012449 [Sphagnurus paluster]|uniref:Uncharacterized protein n=1 Tax=Sphagnurus paluster TaxID=117069 RepID=A0A9P7GI04_9AGAR|nr:hypothetical protein H0H81_012449 [Sphagnurus paluster]